MGATVELTDPAAVIDPRRSDQSNGGASFYARAAPSAPTSDGPTPDAIPALAWLQEMREMRQEAATERKEQTKAFVDALDTLGDKMDTNFNAIRADLRRHLTGLIFTFVLALSILAGLAGVGVWAKGMGFAVSTLPDGATPPGGVSAPGDAPGLAAGAP
jgi:hypothetical protein